MIIIAAHSAYHTACCKPFSPASRRGWRKEPWCCKDVPPGVSSITWAIGTLTSVITSHYSVIRWRCNLAVWQVQDAKARFSELLELTLRKGPQVVTRRGIEAAVLVPIDEWRRLQKSARPGLKTLLLGPDPRFENVVPERRTLRRRNPVNFK
ncbi:MAG: type II toxin-antitoxin system Phd/YefM family antitoxin [Candidatus Korobacteraceae bacterium]